MFSLQKLKFRKGDLLLLPHLKLEQRSDNGFVMKRELGDRKQEEEAVIENPDKAVNTVEEKTHLRGGW